MKHILSVIAYDMVQLRRFNNVILLGDVDFDEPVRHSSQGFDTGGLGCSPSRDSSLFITFCTMVFSQKNSL